MNTEDLLNTREKTHGDFLENAHVAQSLKRIVHSANPELPFYQAEALDLICTKLARIVTGANGEADHWRDLAGYAALVVRELEK